MQIGYVTRILTVALIGSNLLAGQTANEKAAKSPDGKPQVVPITEEQHHHLVLENEYVRVFHVEVPPHSETKFHQHDMDYVFVTLGDSVVASERVGEKPVTLELKDGETRFTKGGFAHKAVNLSDKPFVNVTVELKKPVGNLRTDSLFDRLSTCDGICWEDMVVTNGLRCGRLYNVDSYHYGVGIPTPSKKLIVMLTEGIDAADRKRLKVGDVLWKKGTAEVHTVLEPKAGSKNFTPISAIFCEFAQAGEDFLKPDK